MKQDEELLTIQEVEDRYKIREWLQREYRDQKNLPYLRVVKKILYRKSELDLWLKQYSVNEVADGETR